MKNAKLKEIVFFNGKFITKDKATASLLEPGFLYGWGLFETMRAYNTNIIYLGQHLKRLKNSCRIIDIALPYSLNEIKSIILKTIELNRIKDAYVRLTLWKKEKDSNILVIIKPYQCLNREKYKKGFQVTVSSWRQNEASRLAQIKTINCLLYQLAYKEAKDKGFDEAIILNSRGIITECSRANIFLINDRELFTPSLECGCLDGITRRAVFDLAKKSGIKVCEGNFTIQDLSEADAAFLTNSLLGIMPLTYINKTLIGMGSPDKLTFFLMAQYQNLSKWILNK